ncbi:MULTISPECIES: sensor domain-containing diguanylate cyclase [Tsukamurella]|uniref:GGDEF domain-containing protein n=2 Tax=Tsukamurella TaxID=2060 RepID=A0A5C5S0I4_9ACTN|nr:MULTISPECIES: GGDEF domain-containing protein [Tsukamurella]NMD54324.1 GGDEF domain-containing protein [Tsukamurella columbiensis]TWS28163.1 GGDEF domain-containing protein [Tsukamurella conjunctivitidis]
MRTTGTRRFARSVLRRLGDREGWRTAGVAEYASAQSWLRVQGGGLALRLAVGGLALMMVPLCVGVLFSAGRPTTTGAMIVFVIASSGSAVLGVWWLRLREPRARDAIRFVATADICLFAGCLAQAGTARISGTTYLGMLAMLTAFLLGWRVLLMHCLLSVAAVLATTVTTMVVDGSSLGELYTTLAPALAMVFALPMIVQFVVESGRRGIGVAVTDQNRDGLTGLYNRVGMQSAVRIMARREHGAAVVAILDLDRFKQYNDTNGHLSGDQLLVDTGRALKDGLPEALVSRMGGDEFVVVALRPTRAAADAVVAGLRALVAGDGVTGPSIAGSAGVVVLPRLEPRGFPRAVSAADHALYEAKADRSLRLVVGRGDVELP